MRKNKKKIVISISLILVIITLAICLNKLKQTKEKEEFLEQEKQRVQTFSKMEDFKTIEEALLYLDTKFISNEPSNIEDVDCVIKIKSKYDLSINNKEYFEKLIHYLAQALQYKNFYIVDKDKSIEILVICNDESTLISKYYINGDEFYFEHLQTQINIENNEEIIQTKINTKSQLLEDLVKSNWITSNINIGTKESIYNGYDVYFDEGYSIKKINGSIFNIVFNNKYKDSVIENIKVGTDKTTITNTLGEPTFKINDVIGYKCEYFYIFFNNNEISVYPIVTYKTDTIIKIINKYKDSDDLISYINEIKNEWKDYDVYDYDSNYVILQYTLKGIKFKYDNSEQKGIVLYSNYNGNITETETIKEAISAKDKFPSNMYYINKDLVFDYEKERTYKSDFYFNIPNNSTNQILNISNKYKVIVEPKTNEVMFINLTNELPNSTLRENISYGIWLDDYTFIYSLSGKGIFKYNAQTFEYSTILNGSQTYELKKIENNVLYYNNDVSIKIN